MELKNIPISPYEEIKDAFEKSEYPMTGITLGKSTPVVTIAIDLPKVDFQIAACFLKYGRGSRSSNEEVLLDILNVGSRDLMLHKMPRGDSGVRATSGKLNKIFPKDHKSMRGFSNEFSQLTKYFSVNPNADPDMGANPNFDNQGFFYSTKECSDRVTYYITTPRNPHTIREAIKKKEIFKFLFSRTKEQFEANGHDYRMEVGGRDYGWG